MSAPFLTFHGWAFAASAVSLLAVSHFARSIEEICMVEAYALLVSSITYFSVLGIDQEYVRWFGYTFACPGFAYALARTLDRDRQSALIAAAFMALTLVTGGLPYFYADLSTRYQLFAAGCVAYAISLLYIIRPNGKDWNLNKFKVFLFVYFFIVWSMYPAFYWFNSVLDGNLSVSHERTAYAVLEFFAKYGLAALCTGYKLYQLRQPRPRLQLNEN